MRSTLKTLLISMLLTATGVAGAMQVIPDTALTRAFDDADRVTGLVANQSGCLSLSAAVEQVRRQYKGRIVSAETQMNGDQEVHVIKVLTEDGKVKTVRIPGCRRG